MIKATAFDSPLSTSIAFRMTMIAFRLVQPARLTRCRLAVAPAAVGVPVGVSVCEIGSQIFAGALHFEGRAE